MESEVEHESHNISTPHSDGGLGGSSGHSNGVDAATLVSVGSSCVILVSGCIAVACLVAYMRNMKRHANEARVASHCGRACAKCAVVQSQSQRQRVSTSGGKSSLPVAHTPTTADPYATRHLLFDNEKVFCGLVSEMKTRDDDNDNVSDGHGLVSSPPPDYRRVVVVRDDSSGVLYKTHSQSAITSCSSNHEELVGAYEFGRKRQQTAMQTILSEQKCLINDNNTITTAHSSPLTLTPDDDNNSTDSGIRQFTSRAANPFEIREASSVVVSARRREHPFGAITRHRSRRPSWSLSTTMKSSTRLTDETDVTTRDASSSPPFGLSSDDEDVEYEYHNYDNSADIAHIDDHIGGECVSASPSSAPSTVSTPTVSSSSSTSSLSSTISSSFKHESNRKSKPNTNLFRIDC